MVCRKFGHRAVHVGAAAGGYTYGPHLEALPFRYRLVTLIAIGVILIVLAVSGAGAAVQWVFSIYALAIATWQAVGMVRDILRWHSGLDILAVTVIVATVPLGEYVAALLVVLMSTAARRSRTTRAAARSASSMPC